MSMWEPFTEAARRSVVQAQEEARRLGDQDIHTRHLLLGLLAQATPAIRDAFAKFGVTLDAVRTEAGKKIGAATATDAMTFSSRSKRVMEQAFVEARALDHDYIGVEHLSLAVLKSTEGSAVAILTALGSDLDGIHTEILHVMEPARAKPEVTATSSNMLRQRISYEKSELHESAIDEDPIVQLQRWLVDAASLREPNAMVLSTVNAEGQPSSRVVLLRKLDDGGLVFFSGYCSKKGRELQTNPRASLLFYWAELERQIRIEGGVQRVSEEHSDEYFASRPRGHQLSAWASEQSEILESRELLEQRLQDYQTRFEGETVSRPHSWGGYVMKPSRVEFWQGRPNRLHDRLLYTRQAQTWKVVRLSP